MSLSILRNNVIYFYKIRLKNVEKNNKNYVIGSIKETSFMPYLFI